MKTPPRTALRAIRSGRRRAIKHTERDNVAIGLTSGEVVGPGDGSSDARGVGAWEMVGANEIVGLDDGGGEMVGFGVMVGAAEIWEGEERIFRGSSCRYYCLIC